MINIIKNIKEREELIERIDILEKVKSLLLIPETEFTTITGVANYYEVSPETIYGVVKRHREELTQDGLRTIKKPEFIDNFYNGRDVHYKVISNKSSFSIMLHNGEVHTFTNRGILVFNRRSILRVGMLLTQSKIAAELRTKLLNIEEQVFYVNKEMQEQMDSIGELLATAFIDGDIYDLAQGFMRLNELTLLNKNSIIQSLVDKNKELQEKISHLNKTIDELTSLTLTTAKTTTYIKVLKEAVNKITKAKKYNSVYLTYIELYNILEHKYNITPYKKVTNKKEEPLYTYIEEKEWPLVMKTVFSLCYKYKVETEDLVKLLNGVEK